MARWRLQRSRQGQGLGREGDELDGGSGQPSPEDQARVGAGGSGYRLGEDSATAGLQGTAEEMGGGAHVLLAGAEPAAQQGVRAVAGH